MERCNKQIRGLCGKDGMKCTFDNLSIKHDFEGNPIIYSVNNSKCTEGYESSISNFGEMNKEMYTFIESKLNPSFLPVSQD